MKKILILLLSFFLITTAIKAQHKQEFSIWCGGGSSMLYYKLNKGSFNPTKLGISAGIDYTFFVLSQWGVGIGIDYTLYNSKTSNKQFDDNYLIPNAAYPENFYFLTSCTEYKEWQQAGYITVPLQIHFQGINEDSKIYAAAGLGIGIPVHTRYKSSLGTLKTSGFSEFTGNFYEDIPEYGFSTYHNISNSGTLNLKMCYTLEAESGLKLEYAKNRWCYIGLFIKYGLNDIRKEDRTHIAEYQSSAPSQILFNSITNAQYSIDRTTTNKIVSELYPVAIGVQVKLGIGK